jgi:hypothetical protein
MSRAPGAYPFASSRFILAICRSRRGTVFDSFATYPLAAFVSKIADTRAASGFVGRFRSRAAIARTARLVAPQIDSFDRRERRLPARADVH